MRARGTSGASPPVPPDREVWRRSRETEAPADEAQWLLDLAAFADNRLDEEDAARVAAVIARDPEAAADIAAARTLSGVAETAADPHLIARAAALMGEGGPETRVIAFPVRRSVDRRWYGAATWSGLAAAVVLAGWLGFDLGNGLSNVPPFGHVRDEASTSELLDPAPLLLRDFTESSQI